MGYTGAGLGVSTAPRDRTFIKWNNSGGNRQEFYSCMPVSDQ